MNTTARRMLVIALLRLSTAGLGLTLRLAKGLPLLDNPVAPHLRGVVHRPSRPVTRVPRSRFSGPLTHVDAEDPEMAVAALLGKVEHDRLIRQRLAELRAQRLEAERESR